MMFLCTSHQEGLPRAVVEAMSRGCVAIGTKVGGMPEIIHNDLQISSKKRKCEKELLEVLSSLTAQKMIDYSKYSFEISKEYYAQHLDTLRRNFINKFIQDADNYSK